MCKLENTEGVGGGGGRGSKSKRWSRAPRSLIIPYFPVSRPSSFAEFSRDAISVNRKTKIEVRGEHKTSWGGGSVEICLDNDPAPSVVVCSSGLLS